MHILNENNSVLEDGIIILKTFLYKLKRLKKLKDELQIQDNIDNAVSSFKPPIFWKEKDLVKQQLKVWTLTQIKSLIIQVSDLELLIKKNSEQSSRIMNNFIFENLERSSN